MKKIFLIAAFLSIGMILGSFVPLIDENKKAMATVEQIEGVYIFIKSKPISETNYLGTVKVGMSITDDPLHTLVKKCKKEYPSAEGLIISDPNLQKSKADAITFK